LTIKLLIGGLLNDISVNRLARLVSQPIQDYGLLIKDPLAEFLNTRYFTGGRLDT
jgi:hypothetical protein